MHDAVHGEASKTREQSRIHDASYSGQRCVRLVKDRTDPCVHPCGVHTTAAARSSSVRQVQERQSGLLCLVPVPACSVYLAEVWRACKGGDMGDALSLSLSLSLSLHSGRSITDRLCCSFLFGHAWVLCSWCFRFATSHVRRGAFHFSTQYATQLSLAHSTWARRFDWSRQSVRWALSPLPLLSLFEDHGCYLIFATRSKGSALIRRLMVPDSLPGELDCFR